MELFDEEGAQEEAGELVVNAEYAKRFEKRKKSQVGQREVGRGGMSGRGGKRRRWGACGRSLLAMQEGSREGQEEAVSLDGGEEHLEWDGGGGIAAEERGPMSMMRLPIEACTEQHLRGLR